MGVREIEEHKIFYTAADIASDFSISEGEATELVKKLHNELAASGKIVVSGKVPAVWYERQKELGFMGIGQQEGRIPLTEKRLLKLDEFCAYSGLGRNMVRKLARETGIGKRIGHKILYDRVLFDRWCDRNKSVEL